MDTAELQGAFERAAHEAGFIDVQTEVVDHLFLKMKWVRTSEWIQMSISDYLLALSPDAAYTLAGHILTKIMGVNLPNYPPAVLDELMSDGFAAANQSLFLERLGAHLDIDIGADVPALGDYKALAEKQGVAIPSGIRVILAPAYYKAETVFPMMRTALMPRSIANSSKAARLAWIEDAVVKIGKGPGVEGAPEHYVEVA